MPAPISVAANDGLSAAIREALDRLTVRRASPLSRLAACRILATRLGDRAALDQIADGLDTFLSAAQGLTQKRFHIFASLRDECHLAASLIDALDSGTQPASIDELLRRFP